MKNAQRSAKYIFGIWGSICLISGIAAALGYSVFQSFSENVVAGTTAIAAGAILTMLVDTMIPESFEKAHEMTGLITVAGFLASFILSKLGG
jgi:ZIP family zinc transporter